MLYMSKGQATDIAIQAEEIMRLKTKLNQLYSKHTKQPLDVLSMYL